MTEHELIALYRRYDASVKSFGYKMLDDRDEVDDIVAEAWLQVITGKIIDDGFFWACLCGFVKWRIVDRAKHLKLVKRKHTEREPFIETVEQVKSDLVQHVLANAKYLPESRRRAFMMKYVDGYEYEEIATELRISVDTVRVQCMHAIRFLRKTVVI